MRIIHFLQPQGGLVGDHLQHVFDLAVALSGKGHELALVCGDKDAASDTIELLERLEKHCSLGILRLPIGPTLSPATLAANFTAYRSALAFAREAKPDVVHGHGANGGALARLVAARLGRGESNLICVYSPHASSLQNAKKHWSMPRPEKRLLRFMDGIIFESAFSEASYRETFGPPNCVTRIIYDGLPEEDFAPRQIMDMATDFLFYGELDRSKGTDVLIKALARMKKDHPSGALIVGSGPEEAEFRSQVERYGLSHKIFFNPPMKAKMAFLKGGCLVVPSRADSIPHIVLLAGAAGVPMILTKVGAIQEIIGDVQMPLISPNDTEALQRELVSYLEDPKPYLARASILKQRIASAFTIERMADEVEGFYVQLHGGGPE